MYETQVFDLQVNVFATIACSLSGRCRLKLFLMHCYSNSDTCMNHPSTNFKNKIFVCNIEKRDIFNLHEVCSTWCGCVLCILYIDSAVRSFVIDISNGPSLRESPTQCVP